MQTDTGIISSMLKNIGDVSVFLSADHSRYFQKREKSRTRFELIFTRFPSCASFDDFGWGVYCEMNQESTEICVIIEISSLNMYRLRTRQKTSVSRYGTRKLLLKRFLDSFAVSGFVWVHETISASHRSLPYCSGMIVQCKGRLNKFWYFYICFLTETDVTGKLTSRLIFSSRSSLCSDTKDSFQYTSISLIQFLKSTKEKRFYFILGEVKISTSRTI